MPINHPCDMGFYRNHPGINVSMLKAFGRSPAHVLAGFSEERESTEDMNIGSLLDHKVLLTDYRYTTSPFDDFRTKEARAWRDEQRERGVTVFKHDEIETVEAMVRSVWRHPVASNLLRKGKSQVGLFAPHGDVDRKGLVDFVPDNVPFLVDLKKVRDGSPHGFRRQIGQLRYDVQAAYYRDLWRDLTGETRNWAWVCVEAEAPYAVSVYRLDDESLDKASLTWKKWIADYVACEDSNEWPSYNAGEMATIQSPTWILKGDVYPE